MGKKRALITGISGQDGSYLAEYLLSEDYEVFGTLRRSSVSENQTKNIEGIIDDINTEYADMTDVSSLHRVMGLAKPHEIYNLAAMSHVRVSFDVPQFTAQVNALGVVNLLEAIRQVSPTSKVYQASSSEMFGNCIEENGYQNENTPMHPVSPYGCCKLFAFRLMRNYRHSYNMFASNGILFNHESPRRGSNFVTNKVVKTAVKIKLGLEKELVLGNMDSYRDWGCSKDYVKAMNLILNHSEPDDFIIATGKTHSVRDLCEYVFNRLGMDYKDYVRQDEKYMRPEELRCLKGDSTKSRTILGWKPTYTFQTMLDEMVDHWLDLLGPGKNRNKVPSL